MQYTQCKIVGNGSFGVVFQTKISPSGEDAAIKRVLQDKRFKVGCIRCPCRGSVIFGLNHQLSFCRIVSCKSCVLFGIQTLWSSKPSTTPMEKESVSSLPYPTMPEDCHPFSPDQITLDVAVGRSVPDYCSGVRT